MVSLISAAVCAVWLVDNDASNQSLWMVGTCTRKGTQVREATHSSERAAVVLFTQHRCGVADIIERVGTRLWAFNEDTEDPTITTISHRELS
jgi:hypothetical protein